MGSIDLRIKRAIRRSKERRAYLSRPEVRASEQYSELAKLFDKQDLQELRELLGDETFNMQQRLKPVLGVGGRITDRRIFVKKLHMLTFDETYRDAGPEVKSFRVRQRIELLVELCHGDEALFLREYSRAIEHRFPIDTWSSRYDWAPKLVSRRLKSGALRKTVKHHMSYRPS